MSSYRGAGGAGGAWDGGPPGAEADYAGAPPYAAPAAPPRAMPTTDPWTGVSYSQYGAPPYDYQAYAPSYGYSYDSSYYQRSDGTYYGKYSESSTYSQQQHAVFDIPPRHREQTRSPVDSHRYERRRSYRTNSRSVSPFDRRERAYSTKRDSSYEEGRRRRSRSKSSKRKKYTSSDRSSSRSRSYSHSPHKRQKKRHSVSSHSSVSDRPYKKKSAKSGREHSPLPRGSSSSGSRGRSGSHRTPSADRLCKSPREDERKIKDIKSHSKKKDKKSRKVSTPPRKLKKNLTDSKKPEKLSLTPPPKVHKKNKNRSDRPSKKFRENSLTPPKTYRRSLSSKSLSRSPSGSPSPPPRHSKRKRSTSSSPHASRVRSFSRSASSTPPRRSRSKSKRKAKRKSRSKSRSKLRSVSKSRSMSRRRSISRGKGKHSVSPAGSKSRSRSHSPPSRSHSGTPTDDERRGQFTVADRKRFWKMHRNRQEEKEKEKESKTPPKELKPPPGAVESTTVDDIQYGDPPEVEGPNFAELLMPDQAMHASTSKSKPGPIPIKNDGSFLEMFKKMQEETKKAEPEKKTEIKKPILPFIGKRRGGRVLKTGLVKKAKAIDEQTADNAPKDAWSLYMQEVKKYRETSSKCPRESNPSLTSKLHLLTRGSLTRTRQGTATPATWTFTVARRSAARSTSHATTSSVRSGRCAPMSGSKSGTPNALKAPSLEGSKVFQNVSVDLLIYASFIFT